MFALRTFVSYAILLRNHAVNVKLASSGARRIDRTRNDRNTSIARPCRFARTRAGGDGNPGCTSGWTYIDRGSRQGRPDARWSKAFPLDLGRHGLCDPDRPAFRAVAAIAFSLADVAARRFPMV